MKINILLLIITFAFTSCKKEQIVDEFVPGDLNVAFKEKASLEEAFNLVNSFHLEIEHVVGHQYVSDLPNDSIDYVIAILRIKEYLNDERWQVVKDGNVFNHYATGKISVNCSMLRMTTINQDDWFSTVNLLKLSEQPYKKVFSLKVPIGQEIFWREIFRSKSIVEWAELNSTVEGTFFH